MFTISLLGNPAFTLNDQSLSHLVTGRSAALLAYLAVTGQPQPRTGLTDLLWENMAEAQARTNLRYLLSNLRKIVGDYVVAQRESVAFNQNLPHWVDVTAFRIHMSTAATPTAATVEPEILQALLNLYTGEFLAGVQVEDAPIFERWQLTQRRHLHDLLVQGLRLRTQQHLRLGEYAEGLAINHYLLTLEPWREEAHRQRMLLLAHSGQRSAALQQYTCCCQALAEELDVPPMPQTTALYEQIKSGQWFTSAATPSHHRPLPVAIPPFPSELPVQRYTDCGAPPIPLAAAPVLRCDLGAMPEAAHFVGRCAELTTLHSWVGHEQSRLIALLGLNGQGKSALAAAFVQDVIENEQSPMHGFTQVIWRSLQGTPSCTALLQGWLQQLEGERSKPQPLTFDELITRLFAILQTRRCLLVLDGLEELLATPTGADRENGITDHPWLAAPVGTTVIARQVLLSGKYSATIYAYAVSLLLADRLPKEVLQGLDVEPAGLGRIILNSQLENRREVLWYGREQIADLPEAIEVYTGNDFISRTYRIIVGNQPVMLINEKFPSVCPVGKVQ